MPLAGWRYRRCVNGVTAVSHADHAVMLALARTTQTTHRPDWTKFDTDFRERDGRIKRTVLRHQTARSVMLTPGASTSTLTVCASEAVFALPSALMAIPAGTRSITSPLRVGVTYWMTEVVPPFVTDNMLGVYRRTGGVGP